MKNVPNVPFTRLRYAVSRRRPAPPQEPLRLRRTRLKLVARTYLDALDRQQRSQLGSDAALLPALWELGSYHEFSRAFDDLRSAAPRTADAFWAVYVIASDRHLDKRAARAERALDWIEKHPCLQEVFVPWEVSFAAGYPTAEGERYERPKRLTRRRRAFILTSGSGEKHAQKPDLR